MITGLSWYHYVDHVRATCRFYNILSIRLFIRQHVLNHGEAFPYPMAKDFDDLSQAMFGYQLLSHRPYSFKICR
jgi:hypothetical protein